ncbi:MAG: hypothetical protein LBR60_08340 [Fibrobacter sp.]|jgi:hypothetical protein|nr:hypothetical protein [Fibrobacter sp.]
MKKFLAAIAFSLLFSSTAFAQSFPAVEVDVGYSSPNKGLLGVRYSPLENWSFGVILGSFFGDFHDYGLSYSYHLNGRRSGFYIFQSHHMLISDVGNVWEIVTGGGFEYVMGNGFLAYGEFGIPLYVGGYKLWRYYRNGVPYNKYDGDKVMLSFRSGIGIGYRFEL